MSTSKCFRLRDWLHGLAHDFALYRRELILETVAGGGHCYGLRCKRCGRVEYIAHWLGERMERDTPALRILDHEG